MTSRTFGPSLHKSVVRKHYGPFDSRRTRGIDHATRFVDRMNLVGFKDVPAGFVPHRGARKEDFRMLSRECLNELRSAWLPNITDAGLDRLVDMLEKGSPLLIHGCFTRAVPMGCLATHAGWNHPQTAHLHVDAGISWLHRVAGLNPATSHVIREWDRRGAHDLAIRADLLEVFRAERYARDQKLPAVNRICDLVEA